MVAKLIAIDGPEKGLELILEKGSSWVIGRDPKECDFVLDDPKVSRKHARLSYVNSQYFIENLSQTNPILLNKEPIDQEELLNFDQILKIGETNFKFVELKMVKGDSSFDQLFEDLDQPPISIQNKDQETPNLSGDDNHYDTIFQDIGDEDAYADLSKDYRSPDRFVIKVLSGPNLGAEFSMQKGRSYIIGTDVSSCDVIFNDLSVSRHHARIAVTDDDEIIIEDLDSRNGVKVDDQQIQGQKVITPKNQIVLGTTLFIVVDREAGEETIITKAPIVEKEEIVEEVAEQESLTEKKGLFKGFVSESTFIFTGIMIAVILVLGTGAVFLFKTSPVEHPSKDYTKNIQAMLGKDYPDVKFTYNQSTGSLFLVGHVLSAVDKDELIYKLNNLNYITQIEDNIVVDNYVSQEMNLILSRNPNWQGISIQSPQPGQFVLSGYLPNRDSGAALSDYINVQFPYIDRLTNYVVIEEDLYQDILSKLYNYGFYNIQIELANGEVTFTGYINASYEKAFHTVTKDVSRILGVRKVNDYVVIVGKTTLLEKIEKDISDLFNDPSIVNLTNYMNDGTIQNYTVTGYAEQNCIGKAIEVNGNILTLGDTLDGMKIIAFDRGCMILEKNNLKYKIEYNK